MTRKTWATGAVVGVLGLVTVLAGCSADDARKVDRAAALGCTQVPEAATSAIAATLTDGFSLGDGISGFERDGRWFVAASLVDGEGLTEVAGFGVDSASEPVIVTAETDHAQEASSAPAGSTVAGTDVLDCIVTIR